MSEPVRATLLLIDDEPALLRLMKIFLERSGYAVDAFASGTEGWRRYQETPAKYDLVIADLTLPDFDMEAMLPRFAEASATVRVLVCTGRVYDTALLPWGMRDRYSVLQKPFVPKMLIDAVEARLRPKLTCSAVA